MSAGAWVAIGAAFGLAGAAQDSSAAAPNAIDYSDPPFKMTLPTGYVRLYTKEVGIHYVRQAGGAPWEKIQVRILGAQGTVPQDAPPPATQGLAKLAGIPEDAQWGLLRERWGSFEIDAAEARFAQEDGTAYYGFLARLPLAPKHVVVAAYAPSALEKQARADVRAGLMTLSDYRTNWIRPEEVTRLRQGKLLLYAGLGAAGAYFLIWVLLFRGRPMMAHLFRTACLFAIGLLFLASMIQGGPLYLLFPCLLYVALASRRIKVGVEEGD